MPGTLFLQLNDVKHYFEVQLKKVATGTLGFRIRSLREEMGLSQREFARRLGKPQGTVSAWELNKVTPDSENLASMAALFRVKMDDLIAATNSHPAAYTLPSSSSGPTTTAPGRGERRMDTVKLFRKIEGLSEDEEKRIVRVLHVIFDALKPDKVEKRQHDEGEKKQE